MARGGGLCHPLLLSSSSIPTPDSFTRFQTTWGQIPQTEGLGALVESSGCLIHWTSLWPRTVAPEWNLKAFCPCLEGKEKCQNPLPRIWYPVVLIFPWAAEFPVCQNWDSPSQTRRHWSPYSGGCTWHTPQLPPKETFPCDSSAWVDQWARTGRPTLWSLSKFSRVGLPHSKV